jgi:Bacterial Ig domain
LINREGTPPSSSTPSTTIGYSPVSHAVGPVGVAVDSQYVYWTASDRIGRASLDGLEITKNLFADASSHSYGIAVDSLGPPPPDCRPLRTSTSAGQPVAVVLSCRDQTDATLTYSLDTTPTHGVLSAFNANAGDVTYTPAGGYSGPDSFTYHATSANGTSATQTVSITVNRQAAGAPPRISNASMTNRRFRVARHATAITARKTPLGTTFRFTLSTAARLGIIITRPGPGLRSGGRCVSPSRQLRGTGAKRCSRTLTVGRLTRKGEPPGADSVSFSGRIGQRALSPHAYAAILTATNHAGPSKPATLSFVVVH